MKKTNMQRKMKDIYTQKHIKRKLISKRPLTIAAATTTKSVERNMRKISRKILLDSFCINPLFLDMGLTMNWNIPSYTPLQ